MFKTIATLLCLAAVATAGYLPYSYPSYGYSSLAAPAAYAAPAALTVAHAPVASYAAAPVATYAAAPVASYAAAPVAVAHAPVASYAAPLTVAHAPIASYAASPALAYSYGSYGAIGSSYGLLHHRK